ncbi:MAG: hypothetical protein U9O94_09325 [Nanoarchaeota archaeon]|nr:hypothetical protein [Nanoarchaeota archaeon]
MELDTIEFDVEGAFGELRGDVPSALFRYPEKLLQGCFGNGSRDQMDNASLAEAIVGLDIVSGICAGHLEGLVERLLEVGAHVSLTETLVDGIAHVSKDYGAHTDYVVTERLDALHSVMHGRSNLLEYKKEYQELYNPGDVAEAVKGLLCTVSNLSVSSSDKSHLIAPLFLLPLEKIQAYEEKVRYAFKGAHPTIQLNAVKAINEISEAFFNDICALTRGIKSSESNYHSQRESLERNQKDEMDAARKEQESERRDREIILERAIKNIGCEPYVPDKPDECDYARFRKLDKVREDLKKMGGGNLDFKFGNMLVRSDYLWYKDMGPEIREYERQLKSHESWSAQVNDINKRYSKKGIHNHWNKVRNNIQSRLGMQRKGLDKRYKGAQDAFYPVVSAVRELYSELLLFVMGRSNTVYESVLSDERVANELEHINLLSKGFCYILSNKYDGKKGDSIHDRVSNARTALVGLNDYLFHKELSLLQQRKKPEELVSGKVIASIRRKGYKIEGVHSIPDLLEDFVQSFNQLEDLDIFKPYIKT